MMFNWFCILIARDLKSRINNEWERCDSTAPDATFDTSQHALKPEPEDCRTASLISLVRDQSAAEVIHFMRNHVVC